MGSSPPPSQVEDQTDEDFFDRLVDDELVVGGFGNEGAGIAKALSDFNVGGSGEVALEDSDAIFVKSSASGLSEARGEDDHVLEDNASVSSHPVASVLAHSSGENHVGTALEVGSPDSSAGINTESKGTRVRVVQWSSFDDGAKLNELDVFGSLDISADGENGSFDREPTAFVSESSIVEEPASDLSSYFGAMEPHEGKFSEDANEPEITQLNSLQEKDGQDALNENDPKYWENMYPGWKYDFATGQWYQIDSYDTASNSLVDGCNTTPDTRIDGYRAMVTNFEEKSQDNAHVNGKLAEDEFITDEISDVSCSQHTAQSVAKTASKACTARTVTRWNQDSEGGTQYPPNMVFDPQYPGWYYDTNTQQWYSLESYTQSVQTTDVTCQYHLHSDITGATDSCSTTQNSFLHNYRSSNQFEDQTILRETSRELGVEWDISTGSYSNLDVRQPEPFNKSGSVAFSPGNGSTEDLYGSTGIGVTASEKQAGLTVPRTDLSESFSNGNGPTSLQNFTPAESMCQFNQPKVVQSQQSNISHSYYGSQNITSYTQPLFQSGISSSSQYSYSPIEGRSSAGRPPHALVAFGFGGKLIIMKDSSANFSYNRQETGVPTISVLNLTDAIMESRNQSSFRDQNHDYFHTLCKQSFPGPLVGGNAATKDLNKWIDERISSCESSSLDFRKGELLNLLLSLLKLSFQHYGKLRSPFGSSPSVPENDGPESAVTELFASARKSGASVREYGTVAHCMHNLPPDAQIRTTAFEVQKLLVSGRRLEALQCSQEGLLWGPALVLAAQLGEKYYVDTVKQMACSQFMYGSPLRTLCLLIAGQPAAVFSMDNSSTVSHGLDTSRQAPGNAMLDDWAENLAVITANRTKDDELVIVHLGDSLWKERGEITAAHTCYLVAETSFESYSDSARLCLIGADHWKFPRTYASPDAIQRTEFYEYSKVLGNSQFVLLTFQPYKLIYAYMLAEVGKISESLKYCQAVSKSLKNSSRAPEIETWKQLASSLEERLRTHQQGGYGTNLAPANLVGKLFTSIDRSISRMMGSPPTALPPMPQNSMHTSVHNSFSSAPKVTNSQSTMSISSLVPSASVEAISGWNGDTRSIKHNRSVSEPDFGRNPKQMNSSSDASSSDMHSNVSESGGSSRISRIGSQLFQKTIGWVARPRSERQAKLGEKNKFCYDEKLKRWVEEGAEVPAEETSLPPPPTTATFQNGGSDYNINSTSQNQNLIANGVKEMKPSRPKEQSPGIPPMPPSGNQFSARGRIGVRSRYVDTFNKGGAVKTSYQLPAVPSVKPVNGANFFVPTPMAINEVSSGTTENFPEGSGNENTSPAATTEMPLSPSTSPYMLHRYPSMGNMTPVENKYAQVDLQNSSGSRSTRTRAASWAGSFPDLGDLDRSTSYGNSASIQLASGSISNIGDDLQEVEL